MHINITQNETGNNKGISGQLVTYLEKENRITEKLNQSEYWFNQERINIQPYDVRYTIDNNIAKLSKDETKFFLINISPSEKEISYLKKQYGEDGAKQQLKQYANQVMNDYAINLSATMLTVIMTLCILANWKTTVTIPTKMKKLKTAMLKKAIRNPANRCTFKLLSAGKMRVIA
jgi:hypothetical protein